MKSPVQAFSFARARETHRRDYLPLLVLYRGQAGALRESWLLAREAKILAAELAALGNATPLDAGTWWRVDLPAGTAPTALVQRLVDRHQGLLAPPTPQDLARRLPRCQVLDLPFV